MSESDIDAEESAESEQPEEPVESAESEESEQPEEPVESAESEETDEDDKDKDNEMDAPEHTSRNIESYNPEMVGTWGGSCTCPDGSIYFVGDNFDACHSLACVGGKSGECHKFEHHLWSGKSVNCAAGNVYHMTGAGRWGGKCTCPDGQTYWVGDNWDSCESLACVNGTPGECHKFIDAVWAEKKVECLPAKERVFGEREN